MLYWFTSYIGHKKGWESRPQIRDGKARHSLYHHVEEITPRGAFKKKSKHSRWLIYREKEKGLGRWAN